MMLKKIDNIYLDIKFDKENTYPLQIDIEGLTFYRFMDYFFLPSPVELLSKADIIKVCQLRLKYSRNLINEQFNEGLVNHSIFNVLLNFTKSINIETILDFGCGVYPYADIYLRAFTNAKLFGFDITLYSPEAVQNPKFTFLDNSELTNNKFDLVVSYFVFHFNLTYEDLRIISDCVGTNGFLLFNIYGSSLEDKLIILQKLGLKVLKIAEFPLKISHNIVLLQRGNRGQAI